MYVKVRLEARPRQISYKKNYLLGTRRFADDTLKAIPRSLPKLTKILCDFRILPPFILSLGLGASLISKRGASLISERDLSE